jgi:hypothetical protein
MNRGSILAVAFALGALPAFAVEHEPSSGNVSVKSGEQVSDLSTVNGGVLVQENASVRKVHTVNGAIELESSSSAKSLESVNGGILVGDNAEIADHVATVNGGVALGKDTHVAGAVLAVNGTVALDDGTEVNGRIASVRGRIKLAAAHVCGGLKTETGDILVGANARVEGGILVKKSRTPTDGVAPVPLVVIGPGAVVEGPIRFEHEVKLFVSETAQIGPVEGAVPMTFSGEKPPAMMGGSI